MEFEKAQRKYYETWVCRDKLNDYLIHIYRINKAKGYENGVYHFTVLGRDCNFSSITNNMVYLSFEECVEDIIKWRMKGFRIDKDETE